jgi:predicted GTPase
MNSSKSHPLETRRKSQDRKGPDLPGNTPNIFLAIILCLAYFPGMKLGIIGKPQCGKTTVFNAAASQQETVGDYSQALHRAVIKVPDERVDRLAELMQPDKHTYAEIEFLDRAVHRQPH